MWATPQAILAQENNFDCSKLLTADQVSMPAGSGYFVQLANPFNETDVSVLRTCKKSARGRQRKRRCLLLLLLLLCSVVQRRG